MERREPRKGNEKKEDKGRRGFMEYGYMTFMFFVAAMLGICVAIPLIFGYMAPYAEGASRFLPLESRYLGPVLFFLVHLTMVPLLLRKSPDEEGKYRKSDRDL